MSNKNTANKAFTTASYLASLTPPKSFLKSSTIGGISLLFLLEAAEILTGDPLSLNGLIKTVVLISGTAIAANGRFKATQPISLSINSKPQMTEEAIADFLNSEKEGPATDEPPIEVAGDTLVEGVADDDA